MCGAQMNASNGNLGLTHVPIVFVVTHISRKCPRRVTSEQKDTNKNICGRKTGMGEN